MTVFSGSGILNNLINKLPFELHIPTFQYCGPGTKLTERFNRGDPGINPLDVACKNHDISYAENSNNIRKRNAADRILAEEAWKRVTAKDSSIGEKTAALGVAGIMKIKSKLGMGLNKKRKSSLRKIISAASQSIKKMKKHKDAKVIIKSALLAARKQ